LPPGSPDVIVSVWRPGIAGQSGAGDPDACVPQAQRVARRRGKRGCGPAAAASAFLFGATFLAIALMTLSIGAQLEFPRAVARRLF
jgi:hypothetical protein